MLQKRHAFLAKKKAQIDAVFMLLTFFSIQRNAPLSSSSSSFPMSSHSHPPLPLPLLRFLPRSHIPHKGVTFHWRRRNQRSTSSSSSSFFLWVPTLLFFSLLSLHPTLILHFSSISPLFLFTRSVSHSFQSQLQLFLPLFFGFCHAKHCSRFLFLFRFESFRTLGKSLITLGGKILLFFPLFSLKVWGNVDLTTHR